MLCSNWRVSPPYSHPIPFAGPFVRRRAEEKKKELPHFEDSSSTTIVEHHPVAILPCLLPASYLEAPVMDGAESDLHRPRGCMELR
jgi:hypothetical protein